MDHLYIQKKINGYNKLKVFFTFLCFHLILITGIFPQVQGNDPVSNLPQSKVESTQGQPVSTPSPEFSNSEQDSLSSEQDNNALQNQRSVDLQDQKRTGEGRSFFSTVAKGGWIMVPILGLMLLAMTLIMERLLYFYKKGIWLKDSIETYLKPYIEYGKDLKAGELEQSLRDQLQIYFNDMEKGLTLLHGTGNLGPLVGFFGTVIGMIKAFASIAAAATVNAKVVASGIEIALITTAGGLSVAVPALIAYYFFSHIVQLNYNRADYFLQNLSTVSLSKSNTVKTAELPEEQ